MDTSKTELVPIKKVSKDRHKLTRKRLEQVNAASKRCRQRQKDELRYLRVLVKDLEAQLQVVNYETAYLLTQIMNFKIPLELGFQNEFLPKSHGIPQENQDITQELTSVMDTLANPIQAINWNPTHDDLNNSSASALRRSLESGENQVYVSKPYVDSCFSPVLKFEPKGWNTKPKLYDDNIVSYANKTNPSIQITHFENDMYFDQVRQL